MKDNMGIAINGVLGEMGRKTASQVQSRDDTEIIAGFHHSNESSETEFDIVTVDDFKDYSDSIEVVIDFSTPKSALDIIKKCQSHGIPVVIGTTGFSDRQLGQIKYYSSHIPILKATNFSHGIKSVLKTIDVLISSLPSYDIEIVETHHNRKTDSPSGTAKRIVDSIQKNGDYNVVSERVGHHERKDDEIGLFSRRAGSVHGEHEVVFAGNNEVVTLSHRVEDRSVFASGSIDSAIWLQGQTNGIYKFEDVVS